MAIPKNVFNILNNNFDLVLSKRFKPKHLVELVTLCPAHSADLPLIYKCSYPYCGSPITQKQAYYYLDQFKKHYAYIRVAQYALDAERLNEFRSIYYDKHGFIKPLDQNFREPRKASEDDFYHFMGHILNTDGFKSSGELYQRFINNFNFNQPVYSVDKSKNRSIEKSISIEVKKRISRNTFNRYLLEFFRKNEKSLSQFKYKIIKAKSTKTGYYTEENKCD